MTFNRNFINVMVLSWGFMLVFTAFQTMGNIEKTVLQSIQKENPNFTGEAYTSFAIIYAVLATCNWLAPSYISMTGPRIAILTGACCYVFFIGTFLWPQDALLYSASAILGLGAALIWTGHGQYLTENSDSETMSRNAGIFWAIFQTSMFTGNLFVYFMFTEPEINASKRKIVFSVLTALAIVGTCLLATLKKTSRGLILGEIEGANRELQIPEPIREKPLLAAWHALTDAFSLFFTSKMLLLSLTFVYTGIVLTFYSGVYSSSIGFTKAFGDTRKSLVGLSGIFIGIGEVIGGSLFGIFASKVSRICGVWAVVLTGFCVHSFAFITIFLNLPNDAPFEETTSLGYINPSPVLAIAGSLALGFGDACYNTQVYSLLGLLYAQNNASAFALFKFCQSLAAAVSFAYSSVVGLHIQLFILVITIIIGTITFCFVERVARIEKNNSTPSEDNSTYVTQ
ncbi:UNC93-like protein MFSD11 [Osmia lignaria lignaria]|uniref:UNC93-like protein MFSD11 n=1 Tax=Osmia lignaria lignaria TaxID=1437193 RepID=UPI0014795E77|nr:UNC93-like protein MFSD11 [Osmia lignaria]